MSILESSNSNGIFSGIQSQTLKVSVYFEYMVIFWAVTQLLIQLCSGRHYDQKLQLDTFMLKCLGVLFVPLLLSSSSSDLKVSRRNAFLFFFLVFVLFCSLIAFLPVLRQLS